MSSATYVAGRQLVAPAARAARDRPGVVRRRRSLALLLVLVVLVSVALMLVDRGGAEASLEDRVAGHVVVQPGESLWDVAVATAPDGVDPRQQLADLRDLNGIDGAHIDRWTVVLIPAR